MFGLEIPSAGVCGGLEAGLSTKHIFGFDAGSVGDGRILGMQEPGMLHGQSTAPAACCL